MYYIFDRISSKIIQCKVYLVSNLRAGLNTRFIKKKSPKMAIFELWLGWQDSNLRMSAPKADALPLGDTPI